MDRMEIGGLMFLLAIVLLGIALALSCYKSTRATGAVFGIMSGVFGILSVQIVK